MRERKVNDKELGYMDRFEWTCCVCKCRRIDAKISVRTTDTSHLYSLPEGSATQNVRYCNDKKECIEKSKTYNHI